MCVLVATEECLGAAIMKVVGKRFYYVPRSVIGLNTPH